MPQQLLAEVGWTSFSGVFSTVFPLVILVVVLALYALKIRKYP